MNKKILCALNQFSGAGNSIAIFNRLQLDFPTVDWVLMKSTTEGDFQRFISEKILIGIDCIVVLGGDGTMHDVVNAVVKNNRTDIPIMLFPAGSGNAFNHDLACLNYTTAKKRLESFQTRKIDLLEINYAEQTTISFNMIGWGLVSDINAKAENWRSIGSARYTLASLVTLMTNPSKFASITLDEETISDYFSFILILNNQYTGSGMKMAPLAKLDDGLMDVLLVRKTSLKNLLMLFPKIYSGKHISSPLLEYRQVKKIAVNSTTSENISVDGELKGIAPFEARIHEQQLTVIC